VTINAIIDFCKPSSLPLTVSPSGYIICLPPQFKSEAAGDVQAPGTIESELARVAATRKPAHPSSLKEQPGCASSFA
jgi:hypothetical protein